MTLTWCHSSLFWTYAIPKTWAQKKNKHQMGQSLHCRKSSLLCSSNSIQQQSHIKFVWTTTMRVWTLHMRVCAVCDMLRVRDCRCVRVCLCICVLEPHISAFCFCALLAVITAAVSRCLYQSHRPLSSQALYYSILWHSRYNKVTPLYRQLARNKRGIPFSG